MKQGTPGNMMSEGALTLTPGSRTRTGEVEFGQNI